MDMSGMTDMSMTMASTTMDMATTTATTAAAATTSAMSMDMGGMDMGGDCKISVSDVPSLLACRQIRQVEKLTALCQPL